MNVSETKRVQALIQSEVARWKFWDPGFNKSKEEIEAFAAQRADYCARLVLSIGIVAGTVEEIMSAVGYVLGRERVNENWQQGVPEPSAIVIAVRARLREKRGTKDEDETPWCEDCERDDGCPIWKDVKGARRRAVLREPNVCVTHHEIRTFKTLTEAYIAGKDVRIGRKTITPSSPPPIPLAMIPKPRVTSYVNAQLDALLRSPT